MPILFQGPKSWKEKVVSADNVWSQVSAVLKANNMTLPGTPRRPDVRLILDNVDGFEKIFRNPGDHSNSKAERVPGAGDKTAAMVMLRGETLAEQQASARTLVERFSLNEKGLSSEFVQALANGGIDALVKEAYGPAPFKGQAEKLVDVDWTDADGTATRIAPAFGRAAAYGARAAAQETALNASIIVYVKGTTTTPELVESEGMVIAVEQDWKTGAVTTRPIVASVAREFYGEHFKTMPVVDVHPDGYVTRIDLKNGTVFELATDRLQQGQAPKADRA